MLTDKLLEFIVNSAKSEERIKHEKAQEKLTESQSCDPTIPRGLREFWAVRVAGDLIRPATKKAEHHRTREKFWTEKLQTAEVELREKGVSVEVYDSSTQTYQFNNAQNICSGGLTGATTQNFQPRVDQKLLDNVKNAKAKMLDHRGKAEGYEKYARAFLSNPEFTFRLSVEDIHYFGLEG